MFMILLNIAILSSGTAIVVIPTLIAKVKKDYNLGL